MWFPVHIGSWVFLLSAALIVYVIAGHPLLLKVLAARFGRLPQKRYETKPVSMLIAVFNGEKFIAEKLDSVVALDYPKELLQVIVLSDGSTDGTARIAAQYADRGIQVVELPRGGKPAAINAGMKLATGDILVLTDARQTLEPDSLREMVACFADPAIGVVSGDLPMRKGGDSEESNTSLYWRYERAIRKDLGKLGSTFGATGPFYAIRRSMARPMPADTLLDDMFLPLGPFFQGYRVIVDEQARALEYPFSVKSEFTRKIRTQAGIYQTVMRCPALLTPKNRLLFHFVSYKLGRLALPWLFLVLLASSFWLPPPFAAVAVVAQAVFYLAALLDFWLPEGVSIKRITAPARIVVVMLAAAGAAVAVFFVPPHKLWKVTEARHRGRPAA
jgi:cellulose synthase/poly-beta-1,6-N-acetylglucosamine synthase-like glycosyltransferase